MVWYTLRHQKADEILEAGTVTGGWLYRGETTKPETDLKTVLSARKIVIDGMARLVELYENNQPIYVRINSGARQGSIAKMMRSQLRLMSFQGWNGFDTATHQGVVTSAPSLYALITRSGFGNQNSLVVVALKWLELTHDDSPALEFDGRKPVKINYGDKCNLEFLPDYTGETVYEFARAESKSAEQKAKEQKAKDYAHTPLDMFGNKVAQGDMIIYARAGELVIGRLLKVNVHGNMTVETIMDRRELRLQGSESSDCIVQGKNNPALMKFDKNENLSQKLMIEKLKK